MKRFLLLISLAFTFLSGCSISVPDCGDAKTTSIVSNLALQTLLGEESKNLSDMFKVEISAVQTVTHSKDPEKYTCKANVKITTVGKLDELFGHTNEKVKLILKNEMPASEAGKLGYYADFAQFVDKKYGNKSGALIGNIDPDLETMVRLYTFFKPGKIDIYDLAYSTPGDVEGARAKGAMVVMLNTPLAIEQSTGTKTIEYISTSAQQNGTDHHFVEIQNLSRPNILLREIANFSKNYVQSTPAIAVQPSLTETASSVVVGKLPEGAELDELRTLYCKVLHKETAPLSSTESTQFEMLQKKYAGDYETANENRRNEIMTLWDRLSQECGRTVQ